MCRHTYLFRYYFQLKSFCKGILFQYDGSVKQKIPVNAVLQLIKLFVPVI